MKFFYNIQVVLKNGFYVDYYFKKFSFYIYKKLISSNMFYLVDKYLVEKFFFNLKKLSKWAGVCFSNLQKMSFTNIIKIFFLISIQILIITLL